MATEISLLTFALDACRCALAIESVEEVLPAALPARLPNAPGIVDGVLDVRGTLVPLLDVRKRFGLPARPLDPSQHVVVAVVGDRTVAFAVDEALDVVRVPSERVVAADMVVIGTQHVLGIARLDDGLVVIHDLRAFLSVDEALGLDMALRQTGTA